jgi:hypothetical protein
MTKPIELNESGRAIWKHRENKNLFAERSYRWLDRIIILDESNGRQIVDETKFSNFDFSNWNPMSIEEYNRVKEYYREIYN